jgi:hypothetical protein
VPSKHEVAGSNPAGRATAETPNRITPQKCDAQCPPWVENGRAGANSVNIGFLCTAALFEDSRAACY